MRAFLAMPYGKTVAQKLFWEAVEAAIRRVAASFTNPPLDILTGRDAEITHPRLKQHVQNIIDICDFTVAIITEANPNVFWECGYTESQRKPVVYLVDDATDLAKSPVLVLEALKCEYQSNMLRSLMRNRELPDEFTVRFEAFLKQAVQSAKTQPKMRVFPDREATKLPELVASAQSRIHLITTNLSYFADFKKFTVIRDKKPEFAFERPISRGVDVQILTLDPDSQFVKSRAEQLGLEHDVASFREESRDSARRFYQRYPGKANLTIRLYDDLPLQITLMVDNDVVTSVITRRPKSRENLHFHLSMDTPGAKHSFENHFSAVASAPSNHISRFGWAVAAKL